MSEDDEVARDLNTRDVLMELGELKAILVRLEDLLVKIAQGMGVSIA